MTLDKAAMHALAAIPLFAELSEEELSELERLLDTRQFSDRSVIFWIGEQGDEFFVVQGGQVEISCPDDNGNEVRLGALDPGQFFGEISLLDGGPRTATARARGNVALLRLTREHFLWFLRTHPEAAIHMLTVLGRRQRDTVMKVRGIRNVNDAVADELTRWQIIAHRIATLTATRLFVTLNLFFAAGWITLNMLLRHWRHAFDGPHFDLLGLIVTVEALFVSLFVLISQNQQSRRDRIRADLEYQVNLKAHQEVMLLQQKVDRLEQVVRSSRCASHVFRPSADPIDPAAKDIPRDATDSTALTTAPRAQ